MKTLLKILDLKKSEVGRVFNAFGLSFLLRLGYIVGWSSILGIFLGQVGLTYLPILFLANAFLTIIASAILKPLFKRVPTHIFVTVCGFSGAIALFASVILLPIHFYVGLALAIFTQAFLATQIAIQVSLHNESHFNPLESERAFPIIESSEIVGALAGGVLLSSLSHWIAPTKFLLIWGICLLVLPFFMRNKALDSKTHHTHDGLEKKKAPFLHALMATTVLVWALANLVEFEYTRVIQISLQQLPVSSDPFAFEALFAQKIGQLHVIFSATILAFQLALSGRLMKALGIPGSMLLHGVVSVLNATLLILKPGFVATAIVRGSYELSSLFYKTAHDSSYYCLTHFEREKAKEEILGVMKPLGALFGTLLILVSASLVPESFQGLALRITIMGLAVTLCALSLRLEEKFIHLLKREVKGSEDETARLYAVEMLSQVDSASVRHFLKEVAEDPVTDSRLKRHLKWLKVSS